MRRMVVALSAALAVELALVIPALAGEPRTTLWVCVVPDEGTVVFVTAAEAARHGITVANARAGTVFHTQFGEVCTVE